MVHEYSSATPSKENSDSDLQVGKKWTSGLAPPPHFSSPKETSWSEVVSSGMSNRGSTLGFEIVTSDRPRPFVRLNSVIQIDEQEDVEILWFASQIVHHPLLICCIIQSIIVLCAYIAYQGFELDAYGDYTPLGYTDARRQAAYKLVIEESYDDYVFSERTQSAPNFDIYVFARSKGSNILTPTAIQELYDLEQLVLSYQNYSDYCLKDSTGNCYPPITILDDLLGRSQSEIESYILDIVINNVTSKLTTLSSRVSADSLESDILRSIHYMGTPLPGYNNYMDSFFEQVDVYNEWGFEKFYMDFRNNLSPTVTEANVYSSSYGMFRRIYAHAQGRSNAYVVISICSVFFLIVIYLRSLFLAFAGILCIILTFIPAYVIFTYIYGIQYFDALMIAIVYVILGIGADDIFVFTDAWRQAPYMALDGDKDVVIRMSYAYRRAAKAMALTQITTMIAFLATAISDIMPIKAFGFWSATCILVAYALVITIYPLALAIQHKHPWIDINFGKFCPCCTAQVELVDETTGDFTQGEEPNIFERFFATTFLDILWRVRYFCMVFAIIFGSLGIWSTTKLSPPSQPSQYVSTVSYEGITLDFLSSYEFSSGTDFATEPVMVWGILSVDRRSSDPWDPEDFGTLVVDEEFDPAPEENQQFLFDICNETIPLHAEELLIVDITALMCPMSDFRNYAIENVGGFPVPRDEFHSKFVTFLLNTTHGATTLQNMLAGEENGTVTFISVKVAIEVSYLASGTTKKPAYNAWEKFATEVNVDAPTGVNRCIQTCRRSEWSYMRLEEALVKGAMQGISIAMPTAFLAILGFTWNLKISLFAIITIVEIILSVVNVIVWSGWEFGIVETVTLVLIIGFSVDYVVHLGHSYWEARHNKKDRMGRAKIALMTMGGTVSMGAITTMFGGLPLIFTDLIFFKKMGTLMVSTIMFSWFWAMFLYMPLLMILGPQGDVEWMSRRSKRLSIEELNNVELAKYDLEHEANGLSPVPPVEVKKSNKTKQKSILF